MTTLAGKGLKMTTFASIPLHKDIQSGLEKLGFESPTPVQQLVLPEMQSGEDLIVCAETGSGKTAAFGIPMVQSLLLDPKSRGLILAPTRELVHQIADFLRELTIDCRGLLVTSLVGGADIRKQTKSLKRKPRIIVATPGRLIDHLKRKNLDASGISQLVLDEGDRMLDMGFAPQLDEILEFLPEDRQSSLFTATLPKKVQSLADKYLSSPKKLGVGRESLPVAAIKQSAILVKFKDKDEKILDELNSRDGSIIVFAKTQYRTDRLAKNLKSYGYQVEQIHGGRTQGQRNQAIRSFREGKVRVLCATDIAARGIDVPKVEHVINFDLPMMKEDYVHRIGRTARNGAEGEAVSFVTPEEMGFWKILVSKYKITGADLEDSSKDSKNRSKKKPNLGRSGRSRTSGEKREGSKNQRSSFGERSSRPKSDRPRSSESWSNEERSEQSNFGKPKSANSRFSKSKSEGSRFSRSSSESPRFSKSKSEGSRSSRSSSESPRFSKSKSEGSRSSRPSSESPRFSKSKSEGSRTSRSNSESSRSENSKSGKSKFGGFKSAKSKSGSAKSGNPRSGGAKSSWSRGKSSKRASSHA